MGSYAVVIMMPFVKNVAIQGIIERRKEETSGLALQ
jgi:hypothetical protein